MYTLAASDTLAGVASAASKVTCTIYGMELDGTTETYKVLYQGQLAAAAATIYTATANGPTFVRAIDVVNTDTVARTFALYRGGTSDANKITPTIVLAAGESIHYGENGWAPISYIAHDHTTADGTGPLTNDEHDGYVQMSAIADPSAPSSGLGRLYFKNVANRIVPKWVGPSGLDTPVQPALFGNNVALWVPNTSTTVAISFGTPWTARNAGTSAAQSTPAITNASLYASMKRALFGTGTTSTGSSGTVSAQALALVGSSGIGGFFAFFRVGMDPTNFRTDNRIIVGMSNTNAAIAAEPSTINNTIAFGKDSTDTNYQIIQRDASAVTKTDVGRACTAEDIIDFYIFAPSSGNVYVRVVRQTAAGPLVLVDNLDISGSYLPSTSTVLYANVQIQATTGAAAAGLGLNRIYVETDI